MLGIVKDFINSIKSTKKSDWIPEIDFEEKLAQRVYLKKMAKATVLNFVGRTMSTAQVRFKNKDDTEDLEYILNVRPNRDMSATMFWQTFFYRLMDENKVLVIATDDKQLLIADSFHRNEYAIYDDTFTGVTVKNFEFKKTFKMSDVIYLEYNNEELNKFTEGLFKDYGELFGRITEVAMRNNQIRGSVSIEGTSGLNDTKGENGKTRSQILQEYIDKVYKSFKTNSVAIVPKTKGLDYEEYTNKSGVSSQSIEELNKMKSSLIDDIANAIGVPTALIYGEKEELEANMDAYRELPIKPLVKKLQDELNAKLLERKEYQKGERVEVVGVLTRDPMKSATQLDKIISSGALYTDEVRDILGYPELPNGEGKKRLVTKNYEEAKGGEK